MEQFKVYVSEVANSLDEKYKDALLLWTQANTNNNPVILCWSSAGAGLSDLQSNPNAFAFTSITLIDHPNAIASNKYATSYGALLALFEQMEWRCQQMMCDLNANLTAESRAMEPSKENEPKLAVFVYNHDKQMRQISAMYMDLCAWRMNVLVLAKLVENEPLLIADEEQTEVVQEVDKTPECCLL